LKNEPKYFLFQLFHHFLEVPRRTCHQRVDMDAFLPAKIILKHPILTSKPAERNHFNKLKKTYEFNRAVLEWVKDKEAGVF
jgi:hypothetical protein